MSGELARVVVIIEEPLELERVVASLRDAVAADVLAARRPAEAIAHVGGRGAALVLYDCAPQAARVQALRDLFPAATLVPLAGAAQVATGERDLADGAGD